MTSRGDKLLDAPLAKIGGKGLFVKELETALLEGAADIAVHSMKDADGLSEGLGLYTICGEREDPRDAFVSNTYASLEQPPAGSVVGTPACAAMAQLARRPDLQIRFLLGNVNTRLAKLDAGEYDAIILAAAGLIRLGRVAHPPRSVSTTACPPVKRRTKTPGNWDTRPSLVAMTG